MNRKQKIEKWIWRHLLDILEMLVVGFFFFMGAHYQSEGEKIASAVYTLGGLGFAAIVIALEIRNAHA